MLATSLRKTGRPSNRPTTSRVPARRARSSSLSVKLCTEILGFYLEDAKKALNDGEYTEARRSAKHAKAKAIDALRAIDAVDLKEQSSVEPMSVDEASVRDLRDILDAPPESPLGLHVFDLLARPDAHAARAADQHRP